MTNVAFIGLGNMGLGMAQRLLKAGHDLRVYNRTGSKARRRAARPVSAAAVCGVEFRVQTAAHAIGSGIAWAKRICDKLQREGFWLAAPRSDDHGASSEPTYVFRHALFQQVLYERMPRLPIKNKENI